MLVCELHAGASRDSWPDSYWDDWIRLNSTRKGRQCIRPEVCRNFNFGEKGSSKGFFYRRFLKPIRLNDQDIDWMQQDLSYLSPDRYGLPQCPPPPPRPAPPRPAPPRAVAGACAVEDNTMLDSFPACAGCTSLLSIRLSVVKPGL